MRPLIASFLLFSALVSWAEEAPKRPGPGEIPALVAQLEKDNNSAMEAAQRLELAGRDAVGPLLPALQSKKPYARWWAAAALARIADPRALSGLIALAGKDSDVTVRQTAVYWLKTFDDEKARAAIIAGLDDPDPGVRGYAMQAIEQTRHIKALPKLRTLLDHSHPKTRYDALVTIFFLLDEGQLEFLSERLAKEKNADAVAGILQCLTKLPKMTPQVLEIFIGQLESSQEPVRRLANRLLMKGTGGDLGFVAADVPAKRAEAVKKWRKWLADNRDRLAWDEQKHVFIVPGAGSKPAK